MEHNMKDKQTDKIFVVDIKYNRPLERSINVAAPDKESAIRKIKESFSSSIIIDVTEKKGV